MIPINELKHRGIYKIRSRNLSVGIYNEVTKGFIGIREKFYMRYLFEEYHWDTGAPYGTVEPLEFIEMYPFENTEEHEYYNDETGVKKFKDDVVMLEYLEKFNMRE